MQHDAQVLSDRLVGRHRDEPHNEEIPPCLIQSALRNALDAIESLAAGPSHARRFAVANKRLRDIVETIEEGDLG